MPGMFYRPIGRRDFLNLTAKALAAGAIAAEVGPAGIGGENEEALHLALLSDTHVAADPKSENRKFVPWDNLKLVVTQVMEAAPRAVLHDGDVARLSGELEDYRAVQGLLAPLAERCPIYMGMGNHDNRENFLKVFPQEPSLAQKIADRHVLVIEQPMVRIVMLDSLLYVYKVQGLLGKAQRDWLDRRLASCDARPTVVFVHHTLGDGDGELLDAEAMLRILRPYPKVKAVFYGHSHEYSYRLDHGIHLVNLPAVGYNFADKEPVGWVDARFGKGGVDLTLRALGGNRAQDGQTRSLPWRGV